MKNKLYASVIAAFGATDESVPFYREFETQKWVNNLLVSKNQSGLIFLVDDETYEVLGIIPANDITESIEAAHHALNYPGFRDNDLTQMMDRLKDFYDEGGRVNIWTHTPISSLTPIKAMQLLGAEFKILWNTDLQ